MEGIEMFLILCLGTEKLNYLQFISITPIFIFIIHIEYTFLS
jgi:hypothetical protein